MKKIQALKIPLLIVALTASIQSAKAEWNIGYTSLCPSPGKSSAPKVYLDLVPREIDNPYNQSGKVYFIVNLSYLKSKGAPVYSKDFLLTGASRSDSHAEVRLEESGFLSSDKISIWKDENSGEFTVDMDLADSPGYLSKQKMRECD